jgi:hypothetical protein
MDGRGRKQMTNPIKKTLQSERKEEQQAERQQRQRELHTPAPRISPPVVDALLLDLLNQAGEAIAASEKGQKK